MEEVHRWRGTSEQRSYASHFGRFGQFAYFNRQLNYPDWHDKTILDFGGNTGNLLRDPSSTIRPENYYCIDVVKEAIEDGRKAVPEAHWVHYNRYNCSFNPEGDAGLPIPDLGIKFDLILAYSVFTHITWQEMTELIEQLNALLSPNGALAFTFIDPHWKSWPETDSGNNLQWRLKKVQETNPTLDIDNLLIQSRDADWCALVDGANLYINNAGSWPNHLQTCITYHVYYTVEFLRRAFPSASFLPPVNGEMQHCCILRSES